jgi:hypothetical protein
MCVEASYVHEHRMPLRRSSGGNRLKCERGGREVRDWLLAGQAARQSRRRGGEGSHDDGNSRFARMDDRFVFRSFCTFLKNGAPRDHF